MRLSPLDIRQQQFTVRMLRGLDPQEVEAFLEDVAEEYEQLLKENVTLREQLGVHEERARRVNEVERMLTETLVTTQKLTDEMKDAARRDGQLLVREMEIQGEKVMEAARAEEAKIRSGIKDIQRTHRQLLEELKSTVERYQRLLTSEPDLEVGDGHAQA
jgi:cell division initiation protein